jgi:hypothetical protein
MVDIRKASGADNIIGNLSVDTFLTNYSNSYLQDASSYLSISAATVIPVADRAGSFAVYPRSYFLRNQMAPRPHGSSPVQASYAVSRENYSVRDYALEHFIDDRQRATNRLPGNQLELNATRLLTQAALIRRDVEWANKFFVPGVWTTDLDGVATGPTSGEFLQWDQTGADPVQTMLRVNTDLSMGTGRTVNTMVVGVNVHNHLLNSPAIIDRIKYVQRGIITNDLLAEMFGVERYIVARAVYNVAQETTTPDAETLEYIVDANSVWVGFVERSPAMDSPTAIAAFAWTDYLPGVTNAVGGVIRRGRDDRARSDWFQIEDSMTFQAVSADLGAFLHDAVAGPL